MINLTNNPSLPSFDGLHSIQQQNREAFKQRGLPTRQEERWKYTDLSSLADKSFTWPNRVAAEAKSKFDNQIAFVNGYFCSQQSHVPKGVVFKPLSQLSSNDLTEEVLSLLRNENIQQFPLLSLNAALMGDGCFLYVPKDVIVKEAIHIVFINTKQQHFHLAPRNFIFAEKNSDVSVIEEYVGEEAEHYLTNTVTMLQAKENSKINYFKIQNEHRTATHLANIKISQERNSVVRTFYLGLGGKLVREDLHVLAQGENCETELTGLYHLKHNDQHIDNHLLMDHQSSHSKSSMFYKGILEKKSCAVFNGKVHVTKQTEKIHAKQTNRNLLLSPEAEVNTKPELEIYAEDVKCTHGATVGCLNNEDIFYLRSRGIDEAEARQMLTQAFADEVFIKINDEVIRDYIVKGIYAKLS